MLLLEIGEGIMNDTNASSSVSPTHSSTGSDPVQDGKASGQAAAGYDSNTKISSVGDLKEKAPKVYDAMLQGIAMKITTEMKDHQDRLKELGAEARRNSGQA